MKMNWSEHTKIQRKEMQKQIEELQMKLKALEEKPVPLYTRFEGEGAYGQIYFDDALRVVRRLLIDEAVIENEDHEYITFTLHKSLLDGPND